MRGRLAQMATLADVLAARTTLADASARHLQRLVREWQLLADLSFADLLLWVPEGACHAEAGPERADELRADELRFVCVAQCRPTTAPTAYQDDRVGSVQAGASAAPLHTALAEGRLLRAAELEWCDGIPVRREAIPVRVNEQIVAVLGRDSNETMVRHPSQLELAYLQSAADLSVMVADGTFPSPAAGDGDAAPRAGDGLLRLDSDGMVRYASPNALSAFRRLGLTGNPVSARLDDLLSQACAGGDPLQVADLSRAISTALAGQTPANQEVDAQGATVRFRALPLRPRGDALGALVLLQDITELRRLGRQLMSKDATIREIHHRVKNNLQTVAALLRMQARRTVAPEARAALEESMRRVGSIAMVHETLSVSVDETVDFGQIVDRLLGMLADLDDSGGRIQLHREGEFGPLPPEVATSLVLVLTELTQNAIEHAFPESRQGAGSVALIADRVADQLRVVVRDDGVGLAPDFELATSDQLGLQIVQTLVTAELAGSVNLAARADGEPGAEATLLLSIRQG